MSELQVNNIQPISGQALTIKDEGGTASITVATNGEATFAENIKVTANKGINFSAYATSGNPSSNLLDDYEEGTWTPTITVGTITDSKGFYTKVGRICTCSFQIGGLSDTSSGAGIVINNLPFTSSTDTGYTSSGSIGIYRWVNHPHDQLGLYMSANSTSLQFWSSNKDGAYAAVQYNHIASATYVTVYGMVTYATI